MRTKSDTTWMLLESTLNSFRNSSARRQMASVRVLSENSKASTLINSYPHDPKGFCGELWTAHPASKARMSESLRSWSANATFNSANSRLLLACWPGVKVEYTISVGHLILCSISVAILDDANWLQALKDWTYLKNPVISLSRSRQVFVPGTGGAGNHFSDRLSTSLSPLTSLRRAVSPDEPCPRSCLRIGLPILLKEQSPSPEYCWPKTSLGPCIGAVWFLTGLPAVFPVSTCSSLLSRAPKLLPICPCKSLRRDTKAWEICNNCTSTAFCPFVSVCPVCPGGVLSDGRLSSTGTSCALIASRPGPACCCAPPLELPIPGGCKPPSIAWVGLIGSLLTLVTKGPGSLSSRCLAWLFNQFLQASSLSKGSSPRNLSVSGSTLRLRLLASPRLPEPPDPDIATTLLQGYSATTDAAPWQLRYHAENSNPRWFKNPFYVNPRTYT